MATSNEGLVTLKSFAERKGWRINQGATNVVARGKEGGRRIHFWTNAPSPRLPGFTLVAEHRSGLSFEVGADYRPRPLMTDFKVEIAPDGSRQLVKVRSIAPDGKRWFESHARSLPHLVPLWQNEVLTVTPQTVALSFDAAGEMDLDKRLRQLVAVADLLPRKMPHRLPAALRPLSAQIRRWAISDDYRREERLSAISHSELEHLVQSWRANAELINAVIEADPSSSISVRLMAFAQAGMEAESIFEKGHRT